MKKIFNKYSPAILAGILCLLILPGCLKKLDLVPENSTTSDIVFKTVDGYKGALGKLYLSMAAEGDIPSTIVKDGGNTGLLRQFFNLQELTTDEGGWNFTGDKDPLGLHQFTFNGSTQAVAGCYYKAYYIITVCNNFIQESTDSKLASRGFAAADVTTINGYRAEARYLRAFNYWILMDLFGNVPFADESIVVGGGVIPKQIKRAELFKYIESELKAIETELSAPKANQYGRVDRAADWALQARMYLNAQVYTGTPKYTEAATYARKVIDAGYTLHPKYKELMLADNYLNTDENIWMLVFDGKYTQSYSGTTFLVHAPAGVTGDSSGTSGTWNCLRMTEQFVDKFDPLDIRGQFWTGGQQKNMDQLINAPTNGYSSTKYRNKDRAGSTNFPNYSDNFTSVDFPLFRVAEMYLIYAEAVARGASGGDGASALNYLKALAVRARPNDPAAANTAQLTLPYILDERGRELFWEGFRRSDLVRYGQFTTAAYLWAWKGNLRNGTAVDAKYNLFPLPVTDISSNPNLVQNPGY